MRLRGIFLLVMRRIRGFKQDQVAAGLGLSSQREVSALEHGVGATPEILARSADFLHFDAVDQVVGLETLRFLEASTQRPWHPIELTPAEHLSAMRRSWVAARLVQDHSIDELRQQKLALARALAVEQWTRLEKCPHPIRLSFVEMAPEFRSWALGELVITKSRQAAARDASQARELAELAVAIAYLVGSCRLLSHAYGMLGNALRVAAHLETADALLGRAEALWAASDDDGGILDPGRLGSLTASLRKDQRRFPEALEALDNVLAASREPGWNRYQTANILKNAGDFLRALQVLGHAKRLIHDQLPPGENLPPRDEYLLAIEFGGNLCFLDRYEEAAPYAHNALTSAERTGNRLDVMRSLWLQARVTAGTGHRAQALSALEHVREEFAALALDYDVALVSLEIAALYLELGRLADAQALALNLVPMFVSKKIHREALASLRVACDALRTRAATAEQIRRSISDLYRGRGLPPL